MTTSIVTSKFSFNKFGLLLSKHSYQVKKNDILAGVLIGIEPSHALIDLGLEQVCFLPLRESSISTPINLLDILHINLIAEFLILDIKNNRRIIVSLKRIESIYLWNRLRQVDFTNTIIYAKIGKPLAKGRLVTFNNLSFFALNLNIPKYYRRTNNQNLFIPFKFIEIKDRFHIAHISSTLAIFSKVNKNLMIGSDYLGTITSIKNFGIFVNVLGIRCLVHISELPQKQNLSSFYKRGNQVILIITSKDTDRGKVSISLNN